MEVCSDFRCGVYDITCMPLHNEWTCLTRSLCQKLKCTGKKDKGAGAPTSEDEGGKQTEDGIMLTRACKRRRDKEEEKHRKEINTEPCDMLHLTEEFSSGDTSKDNNTKSRPSKEVRFKRGNSSENNSHSFHALPILSLIECINLGRDYKIGSEVRRKYVIGTRDER